MKPTLTAPGSERLKLKCDDPLSNFGFNFNLRCYIQEDFKTMIAAAASSALGKAVQVDPIKPTLKAP